MARYIARARRAYYYNIDRGDYALFFFLLLFIVRIISRKNNYDRGRTSRKTPGAAIAKSHSGRTILKTTDTRGLRGSATPASSGNPTGTHFFDNKTLSKTLHWTRPTLVTKYACQVSVYTTVGNVMKKTTSSAFATVRRGFRYSYTRPTSTRPFKRYARTLQNVFENSRFCEKKKPPSRGAERIHPPPHILPYPIVNPANRTDNIFR